MSDLVATDTVLSAAVYAYAVRSGVDRRYFGCFFIGSGLTQFYWRAVMDDFGNLVRVSQ